MRPVYLKLIQTLLSVGTIFLKDYLRRRALTRQRDRAGTNGNQTGLTFAFDCERTLARTPPAAPSASRFMRNPAPRPDERVLAILLALYDAGHTVVVWSEAGEGHARAVARACGLAHLEGPRLVLRAKPRRGDPEWQKQGLVDVSFDDDPGAALGKLNLVLK